MRQLNPCYVNFLLQNTFSSIRERNANNNHPDVAAFRSAIRRVAFGRLSSSARGKNCMDESEAENFMLDFVKRGSAQSSLRLEESPSLMNSAAVRQPATRQTKMHANSVVNDLALPTLTALEYQVEEYIAGSIVHRILPACAECQKSLKVDNTNACAFVRNKRYQYVREDALIVPSRPVLH